MTTSIRLPEDLHQWLQRIADAERRTKNNYITLALEDAVKRYRAEHPEIESEQDEEP